MLFIQKNRKIILRKTRKNVNKMRKNYSENRKYLVNSEKQSFKKSAECNTLP